MIRLMKSASTAALAAALCLGAGAPRAEGFVFDCQVLDAATQEVRTAFANGDSMLFRYRLEVPSAAADQQIDVKISARAKVGSISIPYRLDELKVAVPNRNPAPGADPGAVPQSGTRAGSSLVKIPANIPAGTYQVRAKASIEGVGKRTCELNVEVTAPGAS